MKINGQELKNPFEGHGTAICFILIWTIVFTGVYVWMNAFQTYEVSAESYYATIHNSTTTTTTYSSDEKVTLQTPLYAVYGAGIIYWGVWVPLLLWIWLFYRASDYNWFC